jgi:hypothetical protein
VYGNEISRLRNASLVGPHGSLPPLMDSLQTLATVRYG